jgi:hypothetical protein
MKPNETAICVLGGMGIAALVYYAYSQTGSQPIPQVQGEGQAMGLGIQAGMRVNAGTPLSLDPDIHLWHPGNDPVNTGQPTVQPRHRYPAIPGGNMSTVMHKGWDSMTKDSPSGNDWRVSPPEAAVL